MRKEIRRLISIYCLKIAFNILPEGEFKDKYVDFIMLNIEKL